MKIETLNEILNKFKKSYQIQLRWSDLDEFKNVNNSHYLTFFEEANRAYFLDLGWDWQKDYGLIVAKTEIEFHKRMTLQDKPIIFIRCYIIGRKNLDMQYVILSTDKKLIATGRNTLVAYDYKLSCSIYIPKCFTTPIIELEKDFINIKNQKS